MNQLCYTASIDFTVSSFSFSKPTESLQTCISIASSCRWHASMRLPVEHADDVSSQIAWRTLHDFAGYIRLIASSCFDQSLTKLHCLVSRWIADDMAQICPLCSQKFTQIRRKHHCRQCGQVLCSKCCNEKVRYVGMYKR